MKGRAARVVRRGWQEGLRTYYNLLVAAVRMISSRLAAIARPSVPRLSQVRPCLLAKRRKLDPREWPHKDRHSLTITAVGSVVERALKRFRVCCAPSLVMPFALLQRAERKEVLVVATNITRQITRSRERGRIPLVSGMMQFSRTC